MAKKTTEISTQKDSLIRDYVFRPCESKEELRNWIKYYLDIDLPDCTVSEESNSNPLDIIWLLYDKLKKNDDPDFCQAMVYACRGGFKCVEKGALLRTRTGLKKIEDIKGGEEVWSGWAWRKVTDWVHDGVKKSRIIKVKNRGSLAVSPIHKLWTLTVDGPKWVESNSLRKGDRVAYDTVAPFGFEFNKNEFDKGYVLGLFNHRGRLLSSYKLVVDITNDLIVTKLVEFCKHIGGIIPFKDSEAKNVVVTSRTIVDWLNKKECFLGTLQSERTFPAIKTYSEFVGYLTAVLDLEGKTGRKDIGLYIKSKALIESIRKHLVGLGIDSGIFKHKKRHTYKLNIPFTYIEKMMGMGILPTCLNIHRIPRTHLNNEKRFSDRKSILEYGKLIPSKNCDKFLEGINFSDKSIKKKTTRVTAPSLSIKTLGHLVEYAKEQQLKDVENRIELLNKTKQFDWVEIEGVSQREADFYDLTVEEDHSYWSNGLISHNTLGASILELLAVLHLGRNVGHMAAITVQSQISADYVKNYISRPYIKDFVDGSNVLLIKIVHYKKKQTHQCLSEKKWKVLMEHKKLEYDRFENIIKIVVCTMAGSNGYHGELFVTDELDVIPTQQLKAYKQSKAIPRGRNGLMPITLLTSTRKSRIGLVQAEIENSEKSGLKIFHWNVIDITKACPEKRHKPDLPKVNLYINDEFVRHISEGDYNLLDNVAKTKYYKVEGFAGCVKCALFPACKSRLATHQKSNSPMLKLITETINDFRNNTPEFVTTEFLCRKPDTTGLIYPKLNREIHLKTAAEMGLIIAPDIKFNIPDKSTLINFMKSRGVTFSTGMDFGFSHDFAVVTFGVWGHYAFVIDVISQPGLELEEKIVRCEYMKEVFNNPSIYADPAYPSDIKTFKRKGFKIKDWDKLRDSVKGGIEVVRMMLWPSSGEQRLLFLKNDPAVMYLVSQLEKYHFQIDAAGEIVEEPVKEDDDLCDAIRYGIMNTFAPKGNIKTAPEKVKSDKPIIEQKDNWLQQAVRSSLMEGNVNDIMPSAVTFKKGRFNWES